MKKFIITVLLFILLFSQVYSEEIVLYINGEEFIRDYPTSIEEYKSLVDGLVDMYNTLDSDFIKYRESNDETNKDLKIRLADLKIELQDMVNLYNGLVVKYDEYDKIISSYVYKKTRFTFLFGAGPTISPNMNYGGQVFALGEYRIFNNLHIGLMPTMSVYSNNIELGINLVLGYSIY